MKALWKALMLFAFCLQMIFAQVTISSPTLNAKGGIVQETGNLTVSFSLSGITLATGDTITLTFPTGVSIASATPGWTQAFGFTISACAYTSGSNTLVMTASVTGSAPTLLIVEVDNFVYPISKLNNWPATGGTQISIDSGSTQTGTATNAKITNVNSGSITSITINHDATKPNVGDTGATLFFSINAPHSLPADGTIDITFPVQPVTGNDVVVSPTCTQSGGTMSASMSCSYSSTTNIVTISSPLTTARSGEFNFTISGITNPISTAAVSGIDVKTKASDGGNIDTGTQSWSVPNPLTITGATWSLSDTNKVSAYSTHAISFTLNVPAEAQPQIEFIFPTDVPIDNAILGSYIGGTLFKSGSSFITNNKTHVRIVGSDSSNSAGGISFVSFSRIQNPNKIKTTASLTMNIYTSGGASIATFSTGVTIASTALTSGSTNIASIAPSSTIVQTSNVGYTVTFNPGNVFNNIIESPLVTSTTESPKIVITIPSSITLASTCTFSGTSGALNAGLTCSTPNSGIDKQYVLTNPFGTANYTTSGTNLAIRVGEMTNPQVSGNAGTFTVATYLTEGGTDYLVDTGTYSSVTIVTGSLTSPTAATNSTVAYDSDTLFTFGFTPQHSVPINGLIDIHLPSTIPIASSSSLTAGCQAALGGAALASVVCQVVSSTNIRVTNLYTAASSAAVQIRFPGLRNPRNQGTSASFTITTSDSSSTLVDSLNSGFTVTMLSVSDLQSVSIQNTDTNKINGVFDPYRVVITPQTPAINGDKVLVVFPTTMDFPTLASDLSCAAGTNVVTISCTMNSSTKTITAAISAFTGGTIASGTQFDFTINTLRNPISLAPTNMQNVLLVDSSDNNINTYTTASSITIQNTVSADLTGQSLSQSTDVASATATYTFTFTPTNPIPQHAKIQLVYPSAVTVPTSITCTGVSGISTGALDWATEHNTASRTLNILNGFNSTINVTSAITFQVAGITNPSTSTSNSFTLSTLTNGNYGIDTISTGLVPQLECNHPWATWLTSNKDHCLSCPSTGNIYLQGTTCKTSCDSGWTPEGGTTCVQWDSSCLTCTTTSRTQCVTCDSTGSFPYFYSVNQKCYGTWPSGSFLDGAACSQWVSPCSTCTSTTYWESWNSSTSTPYLQTGGTCVTTWGSSQTPVANIWTDCTSPWLTWNTGLPTSWASCTGVLLLYGTGWVGTCPTNTLRSGSTCTDCDSKCNGCTGTTTNCTQCATGLYLHESTCQVCPTGYVGNATSGYCEASSTGSGNNTTTVIGGGNNGDYSLVPFPFLILALFFVLIALGGKLKDWDSQLLPTIIAFWGLIEFFLYITMGILAFRDHDLASIMAIWIVVWILLIIINITFILVFRKRILKDESFQYWRSVFPHTYRAVMIISIIFSFKFTRMFYSRLFGLDNFCWGFTVHGTFLHPLNITSAVNFVTWMLPICLISIVGLVGSSWGTQFYITCIEALLFLLTFIVITIIEFKTATMHGYKRIEDISDVGSAAPVGENIERARKEKILRELLGRIFGEKGFDNNNIDQCVNDERDWIHDRYSIPDRLRNPYDSDEESEMSRHPFSYPVSPRTRARIEEPSFPVPGMGLNSVDQFPDNVYCDSKPPSPLKKKKMPSSTAYTQTFAKESLMGGAFNINEDFFDKDPHKQRRPKHRKRRNAYYNEVEAEDEDGFMGLSSKPKMLGVIYEEDEHGRKVRKSIYADSDSEYDGADSVPITHPDSMDKIFNEHSIMGEFDKDEKGNIILLTDAKGNLVCKNGRKVNEKGYLRDRYGHILYGSKDRVRAFSQKDLDERGEIPLPYSWDRYNFNAFDVMGNIDPEELNKSISKSNEPLTDVNGYQVNRIGLLTDQNGNMISRLDGEIKLDNFQLTPEGDIPMLYTYEGRKFHIQQWMGTFDRDEDGNVVVLSQIDEEGNTKYVDKNNLEVTEKGYLWDALGNILTKDGTIIFEKNEVNKQGEIPKILPYTKFNVDEIRGDLDKDGNGKFALIHENDKGEIMDKKNRKVNAKGYLIDNEGNILDQRGNRVFDCDLIDDTGEIPKVFRLGLLRSDSTTSLNRFLDELENIKHNLGLDEDEVDSGFEEEEKLLMETSDVENKSRHTSDNNSAMGDRPSNYNTANLDNVQRFSKNKDSNMGSSFSSDDFDLDDPEFLEAIKEKRHRRRIRKNKYKKPNKKDMMLANAYGGVPRGAKIEKNPLGSSRSSKQKMIVAGRINRGDRSIHGDSALDIRRDRPYTKSSKKTLEVDTKINFKPAEDQRRFGDSDLGLNSLHDESGIKDKSLGGTLMIDPNKDTYSQNSDRIRNPRGLKNPRGKKKRHRTKGRARRNRGREFGSVAPDNLEKVYEKNVDEFLNDSDWDIESVNNRSQASFKSARSYGDKRIRGLESIYLQRLEAGMKNKKKRKKKPRFRALQDRYLNQDEIPRDEDMTSSIFSEDKR